MALLASEERVREALKTMFAAGAMGYMYKDPERVEREIDRQIEKLKRA